MRIDDVTKVLKVSLRELAKGTSIPYRHIKKVIYGQDKLTVMDLVYIVKFTKISPDEILEIFKL